MLAIGVDVARNLEESLCGEQHFLCQISKECFSFILFRKFPNRLVSLKNANFLSKQPRHHMSFAVSITPRGVSY